MTGLRAGLTGAVLHLLCGIWIQADAAELNLPCRSKHCRGTALGNGDPYGDP